MNTVQISCFLRVVETHSFTKAAAALFMTQQSVSRQVALLEEEVGQSLLDRTTAYIVPTAAGQQYYAALSTSVRQLDILQEKLAADTRRKNLRLRIGISEWLNPFGPLKAAMDSFFDNAGDTAAELYQLDNETLALWLREDRLDLAFFSEGQFPHIRDLRSQVVAEDPLYLYGPEDVVANTDPAAVDGCWGLPMLMVPAWQWSFMEEKLVGGQEQAEFDLHPPEMLTLPNLHSMLAALRFGRCTTVGDYRFGVFNRIPGVGSVPLPKKDHLLLVWPAGREHPLRRSFAEKVQSKLNN